MPSGYFSTPSNELDPNLFEGDSLKEDVRTGLLNALYSDLENVVGFREPWNWVHAWVAGSGVSYQWDADRGNGDLDVLFGVDFPRFLEDNPQFPRLSMAEVASYTDQILKAMAWDKTSHFPIGDGIYEVTFFWNPTTGTSIDNIHPYAAYSLTKGAWDIRPPELPEDPHSLYPQAWYDITDNDYWNAQSIEHHYRSGPSGKLQAMNAGRALWKEIHEGRKAAFSDIGRGYSDFNNFRWQRAKETGAADTLRAISEEADANDPRSTIAQPSDIVTRAAIRYASPRYWQ